MRLDKFIARAAELAKEANELYWQAGSYVDDDGTDPAMEEFYRKIKRANRLLPIGYSAYAGCESYSSNKDHLIGWCVCKTYEPTGSQGLKSMGFRPVPTLEEAQSYAISGVFNLLTEE